MESEAAQPTVLVVDDEHDVRFVMRLALQLSGHRVLEAETGEEALEVLKQELPDAIVLDLRLPGIDGFEVLQRLSANPALRGIPVIVVSAHATPTTPAKAAALGSKGYLTKPFRPDDLVEAIDTLIAS